MEKEATCHCAICPLCDLRFPATSLLEANVGLSEHLRLGHPGLQGDDLIGAYIDAERDTYTGERCFPNVLKDRIPSPKDPVEFPSFHNPDGDNEHMKELARAKLSKEPPRLAYYQYCPKCGRRLEAPTIDDLREQFVKHHREDHPSVYRGNLNDEKIRRLWATTTLFYEPAPESENPVVPLDTTLPKNQWDLKDAVKPPIGIQPEYLWREHRMYALIACINRYHESGFPVKPEWLEELRSILVDSHFLSALKEAQKPC